ncbi:hypothetical protein DY000_02047229 [Brassica cretica]|uniref:Uncharacterized protein n=1 Tax=Brassica cretica TaxID=69181 RepID=A0ABQ7EQU0_BRACR|nr:hypothetical protein DY000_02047229 [Brassica cretica]
MRENKHGAPPIAVIERGKEMDHACQTAAEYVFAGSSERKQRLLFWVLNNVGGAEAETRDKELGCQHAPGLQHGDYLFPQTVPSAPTTRKLETTSSSHVSTSKPSGVRSSSGANRLHRLSQIVVPIWAATLGPTMKVKDTECAGHVGRQKLPSHDSVLVFYRSQVPETFRRRVLQGDSTGTAWKRLENIAMSKTSFHGI